MSELKTLKDIGTPGDFVICGCGEEVVLEGVPREELKQEAIKHIKQLRIPIETKILDENCGHLIITRLKNQRAICLECNSIIETNNTTIPEDEPEVTWIKYFFNITEEELK